MPSTLDLYDLIIDYDNIRQAYFDVIKKFDEDKKTQSYYGIDGLKLNSLNYTSLDLLKQIQKEMISFSPITPAYMVAIPKKKGTTRDIYIYTIKERIKAEAIYNILEPVFDKYLSPFLFSYRKSHPSYFAARSTVRRYKRYYGQNHILIADLSDYTDSMDHDMLCRKISLLNLDQKTEQLLKLFISAHTMEYGLIKKNKKGLMTGTPLSGLLSNLFMDEFDKWAGKHVAFYRRVGDDMIAMDKDSNKVKAVYDKLLATVEHSKLKLNIKKVRLIKDSTAFDFLGYRFEDKKISFDPSVIIRTISKWKVELQRYSGNNLSRKIKRFKLVFYEKSNTLDNQFKEIIKQKILIDNEHQVKEFSDRFYRMLTSYFFGYYSERNRRQLSTLIRDFPITSLYEHYNTIHFLKKYGKS